jgi:hypothetical protein
MEQHVKILGVLNIVWGALGAFAGLALLAVFGGAYGIVGAVAQHQPMPPFVPSILAIVGGIISFAFLILSAPSIIVGAGLICFKPWARILAIVVSALHLFNIPLGTALGVYGLWVLFSDESQKLFESK